MTNPLIAKNNRLFELARSGALRLPGGLPLQFRTWIERLYPLVAFLFSLAVPFVAGLFAVGPFLILMVLEDSLPAGLISPDLQLVVQLVSGFLPIYFIIWFWIWLVEKRRLRTLGLEKGGAVTKWVRGALLGGLIFSAAIGLVGLAGYVQTEPGAGSLGLPALGGVLLLLAGWIIQGGAEEVLYRGYLLPVVGARYGAVAGILVSAGAFALIHGLNPNLSLLALLNLFLFGIFSAFYALYEGGVWGICALHAVWNWVQGNFYGFEVSGGTFGASTIFDLQEAGPDWFTGGPFGPEGGLAVTLVLVFGCIWLWVAAARQRRLAAGEPQGSAS